VDLQLNVKNNFYSKFNCIFISFEGVCCDACEGWFHLVCVGLTSVKKKEEFKCAKCKQQQQQTSSLSCTVSSSTSTPTISVT